MLIDRLEQDGTRRAAASARIENGASAIGDATERRAVALTALEGALLPCGIARSASSQTLRSEISAQLATVNDRRRRFSLARESEQQALSALDTARVGLALANDIERGAGQTVRNLEADSDLNLDRLSEAARRRDQVAEGLDASLSPHFDWREDDAAVGTLDRLVIAWRERAQGLAAIDAQLPDLTKAAHDADIDQGRKAVRLEGAIEAERTCREEQERFAGERSLIFGGEAADSVVNRLGQAIDAASVNRESARLACEKARSDAAAAVARHEQAERSLGVDQADVSARRQALEDQLAAKQVEVSLVCSVAAGGEAALNLEAHALAEIDRAVVVADTEWQSRVVDRDAHAASLAPLIPLDALDDALREASAAEITAREVLSEAQMVIRQDNRARDATAALRLTLEQERAVALPWFQLDVLIGDATGNKFRRYAQGLTLERLLLHANARLEELKPRYSLERAPGGDMLVQVVDHDMAGEVRGLPNLSGGERFLVSLALALGLSEMSTGQGLRVESLFIDEGFGALDSASLGQAIGVLEQLHATGRRVGVISHIEDVKERIAVKIAVAPSSNGGSTIEIQSS